MQSKLVKMSRVQGAPSWLLELPNELLLKITKNLKGNNQALASMNISCKRLRWTSEPFLYQEITTSRGAETQATYLVRTLLEKPKLAARIDKISLPLDMMESHPINYGSTNTVGIL
jgi:hypothetical protein